LDHVLLGKILASIITACIDGGAIATDTQGVISSPEKLTEIASGFLSIWLSHPASGRVPQIKVG
jgi:hypothetical protein